MYGQLHLNMEYVRFRYRPYFFVQDTDFDLGCVQISDCTNVTKLNCTRRIYDPNNNVVVTEIHKIVSLMERLTRLYYYAFILNTSYTERTKCKVWEINIWA